MLRWTIQCRYCSEDFTYDEATFSSTTESARELSLTLYFPPEGNVLECPHCSQKGAYSRQMLGFRSV